MFIFVFSFLFSGPIFFFKVKKTIFNINAFLPILYLVVDGIRQSISISFLMLSITFIYLNKNKLYYFSSILSSLFHFSAIMINGIFVTLFNIFNKQKIKKIIKIFFYLILVTLLFFNSDLILNKLIIYINEYGGIVTPAKGFICLILNFFPSLYDILKNLNLI